MRATGTVDSLAGLGTHDHVCWAYEDHRHLRAELSRFFREGIALGERVMYFGCGDVDELRSHLDGLPTSTGVQRGGVVQVVSLSDAYCVGDAVDPALQLANFSKEAEDSLALGFTGLRSVADVASLTQTPEQVDAFTRWEHLWDRYMTTRPLTSICAYRRSEVSDHTMATMAGLHPLTNVDSSPFHIYADEPRRTAITGEVDTMAIDLFETALGVTDAEVVNGELVLDASGLSFIDHRGMLALESYARRRETTLVLRNTTCSGSRLIEILGLERVRVELESPGDTAAGTLS